MLLQLSLQSHAPAAEQHEAGSQNDQAGSQNDQVITLCWTMHCSKTSQPTLGSINLVISNWFSCAESEQGQVVPSLLRYIEKHHLMGF